MTKCIPFLVLALASACTAVEPSGSPLQPVRVTPRAAPAPVPGSAAEPPPANSPFIEDDPFTEGPDDPDAEPSGADAVLKRQLDDVAAAPPAPTTVTPPMPTAPQPPRPSPWDGISPLDQTGSWGVTLLATLTDVQPPRAVLALPDGTERVVQPGTFLPEHRLVVLAIGRDAVQVAHIEPMGFKSRVETSTIRSLFSGH